MKSCLDMNSTGAGQRSASLLPAIADCMDAHGYKRVSELFRAYVAATGNPCTPYPSGSHQDYTHFLELTEGHGAFEVEGLDFSMRASLLAAFFKKAPKDLFGEAVRHETPGEESSELVETPVRHLGYSQPESDLIDKQRREIISSVLGELNKRDAAIVRFSFDIDGAGEKTNKEIADILGLTPDKVRSLKDNALEEIGKKIMRRTYRSSLQLTELTLPRHPDQKERFYRKTPFLYRHPPPPR